MRGYQQRHLRMKLDVKVDDREFKRVFAEYKKNCKREIEEIVFKKTYFVARNAVLTTPTADDAKIKSDLMSPSNTDAAAPIVALLVNKQRANTGKKGLNGSEMQDAIDKFIRARQRTKNWLRSGWIKAIKKMEQYLPNKGGGAKIPRIKDKGFGGASVRRSGWNPSASIWNSIYGNIKAGSEAKVTPILEKGLQEAVDKEVASMQQYIEKKLQKHHDKFNRS